MLDHFALPLFARPHRAVAAVCIRLGMTANTVTIIGSLIGMAALPLIAWGQFEAALAVILLNRFLDGVDGTMARTLGPTDRGAFLDIACDFLVYAAVPLGFALLAPATNALPAAVLLASFVGSGSTFLAYAAVSAKRGEVSPVYPNKAIYYLGGLTEGTETIIVFCLMCLLPQHFGVIAYVFAGACAVTTVTRLIVGARSLK
jgi:phosphatidylglycerophosphate synthase